MNFSHWSFLSHPEKNFIRWDPSDGTHLSWNGPSQLTGADGHCLAHLVIGEISYPLVIQHFAMENHQC